MGVGGPPNVPLGPGAINPYSPPTASLEGAGLPHAGMGAVAGYKSAIPLANAITVLMALDVLVELAKDLNSFVTIGVMKRVIAGEIVPPAELSAIDLRAAAIGLLTMILSIVLVVLFCFFMPRANRNASALGSFMNISPGWAAGWFFIPFANLWMPYQAMREIWRASDPDPTVPASTAPVSALVPSWWAVYLARSIGSWIVIVAIKGIDGTDKAHNRVNSASIGIVLSVLSIIAAVLAAATVRAVARRQDERYARSRSGPPITASVAL